MSSTSPASKPKKSPKPKSPSTHPPYGEMIKAAMTSLKNRKGVSMNAIGKYIRANYIVNDDDTKFNSYLKVTLKRMLGNEVLSKHKGIGVTGSFKFPKSLEETTKKKAKPASKPAAKKPAAPKKAKPASATAKKPTPVGKKQSPKKSPTKPKPIPIPKPKAKPKDSKRKPAKPATKPAATAKKAPPKKPKTPKKAAAKKK